MSQTCTVCRLPAAQRQALDKALLDGEPVRSVASRYVTRTGKPLGRMAVYRHKDECLPDTLRRAKEEGDLAHALDLVAELKAVNSAAFQVLQQARQTGDGELALKAIDRVVRQLELVAKAAGEIDERPQVTVNVLMSSEWLTVRGALLAALRPYTEARAAAAAALLTLEEGSGHRN